MKINEYIKQIDKLKQKILVYKELRMFIEEYLKTDTKEAERYIPYSAPDFLPSGEVSFEAVVPGYIVGDVVLELDEAINSLDKELQKLLNKELA